MSLWIPALLDNAKEPEGLQGSQQFSPGGIRNGFKLGASTGYTTLVSMLGIGLGLRKREESFVLDGWSSGVNSDAGER